MDEMIDRARRIVDEGVWSSAQGDDDVFAWAEALLAERAAREEAERRSAIDQRQCDDMTAMAGDLAVKLSAAEARVADLEAALRRQTAAAAALHTALMDAYEANPRQPLDDALSAVFAERMENLHARAHTDAVLAGGSDGTCGICHEPLADGCTPELCKRGF